jgi:iron-sulfur cluster repair protein YtfE (RIC family)
MVEAVNDAVQAALRGERTPQEIQSEVIEFLTVAEDEIYEHFDREEQGLFPFVIKTMPDSEKRVRDLEMAHDRMCGVLSRMHRIADQAGEAFANDFDAFVAIFARFEANYSKHSKDEWHLLNELGQQVDDEDREELAEILRAL